MKSAKELINEIKEKINNGEDVLHILEELSILGLACSVSLNSIKDDLNTSVYYSVVCGIDMCRENCEPSEKCNNCLDSDFIIYLYGSGATIKDAFINSIDEAEKEINYLDIEEFGEPICCDNWPDCKCNGDNNEYQS